MNFLRKKAFYVYLLILTMMIPQMYPKQAEAAMNVRTGDRLIFTQYAGVASGTTAEIAYAVSSTSANKIYSITPYYDSPTRKEGILVATNSSFEGSSGITWTARDKDANGKILWQSTNFNSTSQGSHYVQIPNLTGLNSDRVSFFLTNNTGYTLYIYPTRETTNYSYGGWYVNIEEVDKLSADTLAAANNASTAAMEANNTMNTIISPKLDIIYGGVVDGSGNTAISMAQAARDNALTASQNASSTKDQTIYTGGGSDNNKSAAVLSKEGKDKAQEAVTGIANAENNLQSSISNVKTDLETAIGDVQNSITNIQNYMPAVLTKVSGYKKAAATTTTSFNVTLDYTNATEYRYKVDTGSWSSWSSLSSHDTNGYFTATGISGTGMKTLFVEIRNGATGPVSKGTLSIFKL